MESKTKVNSQFQKEIMRAQIISAPGSFLVAIALYGIFAAEGDSFHPFLNDIQNCYVVLGVGGLLSVWGGYTLVNAVRKQAQHKKQSSV